MTAGSIVGYVVGAALLVAAADLAMSSALVPAAWFAVGGLVAIPLSRRRIESLAGAGRMSGRAVTLVVVVAWMIGSLAAA